MRRLFSILLISTVLLMSGFGAFLMLHKDGGPHNGCTPVEGIQCRTAMAGASAAILHISALSRPALIPSFAALLSLILVVMFLGVIYYGTLEAPQALRAASLDPGSDHPAFREFRAWLSIHEKRDPSSLAAVNP